MIREDNIYDDKAIQSFCIAFFDSWEAYLLLNFLGVGMYTPRIA